MKGLLKAHSATVNGTITQLGTCCMCGRKLGRHNLNKTGVRCRFDGSQYDRDGVKLFDARSEKSFKALKKAESAFMELLDTIDKEELLA